MLVIGSAPHANFRSDSDYDLVLLVNGAASRSMPKNLHGLEKMLFLDSSLLWNTEAHCLETLDLILLNAKESVPMIVSASNPVHFTTAMLTTSPIVIPFGKSMRILRKITSSKLLPSFPDGMPSTGVRAVVTAFYFGARSVELAGFSFGAGSNNQRQYFYKTPANESSSSSRNHTCADAFTLTSLILLRYDISSSEPFLEPLLTQWRSDHSWAKASGLRRFFLTVAFRGYLGDMPVLIQRVQRKLGRR